MLMNSNKFLVAHNNTVSDGKSIFDLQLFADEVETTEPSNNAVATEDSQQDKAEPSQASETILGAKTESLEAVVPEKYDFILPEGLEVDEVRQGEFSELAKGLGLTNDAANKLVEYGLRFAQEGAEALIQKQVEEIQQWGEDTKKALGSKYDENVRMASVGVEVLSKEIPDLRKALNETGAGNRIEFVQLLARVGELVGEDVGKGLVTNGIAKTQSTMYPNTDFNKY